MNKFEVRSSTLVAGAIAAGGLVAIRRRRIPVTKGRTINEYLRLALHEGVFSPSLPLREFSTTYVQTAVVGGVSAGGAQYYIQRPVMEEKERIKRLQHIISTSNSAEEKSQKISLEFGAK